MRRAARRRNCKHSTGLVVFGTFYGLIMGKLTDQIEFDEAIHDRDKAFLQGLAESSASDSSAKLHQEAAMLDRLIGTEIAALFKEQS